MKSIEALNVQIQARAAFWLGGGTLVGGAGSMVVGIEDHPLRHVLPDAINYFQHSGNLLWSGLLAAGAVAAATRAEGRIKASWPALKFAGAAAMAGLAIGGVANAAYETEIGHKYVGQYLPIEGGTTYDPADLAWSTIYTAGLAAGMGAHIRRYTINQTSPEPATSEPPGPAEIPDFSLTESLEITNE